MTAECIIVVIALFSMAAAIASAIAAGITCYMAIVDQQRKLRQSKCDTIKEFLSGRHDTGAHILARTLSGLPIVFEDAPEVLAVLDKFRKASFEWNQLTNDTTEKGMALLHDLLEAMCKDTDVNYSKGYSSMLPFSPTDVCMFTGRKRSRR